MLKLSDLKFVHAFGIVESSCSGSRIYESVVPVELDSDIKAMAVSRELTRVEHKQWNAKGCGKLQLATKYAFMVHATGSAIAHQDAIVA
jgi:hypothetical protein